MVFNMSGVSFLTATVIVLGLYLLLDVEETAREVSRKARYKNNVQKNEITLTGSYSVSQDAQGVKSVKTGNIHIMDGDDDEVEKDNEEDNEVFPVGRAGGRHVGRGR